MEEMEQYIKQKYDELVRNFSPYSKANSYGSDKYLKREWKNFSNEWTNRGYGKIINNNDIIGLKNAVEHRLDNYEKMNNFCNEDFYELYKHMYCLSEGIGKMGRCYDNPNCNFDFTKDEIEKICFDYEQFNKRIEQIWMRKVCQD